MFKIDNNDKTTIKCTRGDKGSITIRKKTKEGTIEQFYKDDVVIFSIKNNFGENAPILRKKIVVTENCDSVTFSFDKNDTSIGELISKPTKYQYDVAINEDMTILGYDEEGAKIFMLFPEGSNDE